MASGPDTKKQSFSRGNFLGACGKRRREDKCPRKFRWQRNEFNSRHYHCHLSCRPVRVRGRPLSRRVTISQVAQPCLSRPCGAIDLMLNLNVNVVLKNVHECFLT